MVTPVIAALSWRETMTAAERETLAARIVAALRVRLGAVDAATILYVAAPNPGAWDVAEARLIAMAHDRGGIRRIVRHRRPTIYATRDAGLFCFLLPTIFDLGPPEMTLLALVESGSPADAAIADHVTAIVEGTGNAAPFAGIHYDSGDAMTWLS